MRALWIAAILAGCRYAPTELAPTGGDDTPGDAGDDAGVDALACTTWGFTPTEADPCEVPAPSGDLDLDSGFQIDSDTGMIVGPGLAMTLPYEAVNGVGVVSISSLHVGPNGVLRGVGSLPLALLVDGDISVEGMVDVSSRTGAPPGAGSGTGCGAGGAGKPGTAAGAGDGGGGGGAFAVGAGDGGNGGNNSSQGGSGGSGRSLPARLEAGCGGGESGPNGAGVNGHGGAGGGGIALIAKGQLTITGIVHAGGAGGTGGSASQNGGGGGGSGGMIKLEAAVLDISDNATLAANGGQGGGGCNNATAGNGANGGPNDLLPAQGNSESGGTDGGGGGFVDNPSGDSADNANNGGGGGGASVGFIIYKGHTTQTVGDATTMSPLGTAF